MVTADATDAGVSTIATGNLILGTLLGVEQARHQMPPLFEQHIGVDGVLLHKLPLPEAGCDDRIDESFHYF